MICGASELCLSLVAPFTGAWIEMQTDGQVPKRLLVAPFTGAWIEIGKTLRYSNFLQVAPFTGAWIEIPRLWSAASHSSGRSLHGSVD